MSTMKWRMPTDTVILSVWSLTISTAYNVIHLFAKWMFGKTDLLKPNSLSWLTLLSSFFQFFKKPRY
jgi:hypothetical protein